MQLLPRLCVTCTTTTSTAAAAGESNGEHITTVSSSSSSTASSSSAAARAAASEASSSSTSLPSLPSLSSTNCNGGLAAAVHHLATLIPPSSSSAAAAVAAAPPGGLLVASPTSVALHDVSTLAATSAAVGATIAAAGAVKCVAPLHAGGAAVTGHQDGKLRLWRLSARTGKLRLAAELPTVSDRLRRFPVPSNHVPVRRHHRRLWIEHADAVAAVAAAADGRLLFSASWDKTLKVWTLPSLRCVQSLTAHDDAINAVAVAPDGTVYTGSADRRIRTWASRPGSDKPRGSHSKPTYYLAATLMRHTAAVNALAVGCGGQVLFSGGNDRSIVVWEREDSASHMMAIGALRGHRGAVLCISCAGDDLVLSGSADRTVRIWKRQPEGRRYDCIGVMDGHASAVRSVTAVRMESDNEGYRICSASFDGEVRIWSV